MSSECACFYGFEVEIFSEDGVCKHQFSEQEGTCFWNVIMPKDDCVYSLILRNENYFDCDAIIKMEGEFIGKYRVKSRQNFPIERPLNSAKRFTFFVGGSEGSKQAGFQPKRKQNGMIKVIFLPEKNQPCCVQQSAGGNCNYEQPIPVIEERVDCGSDNIKEGITGLSGHSDQTFFHVPLLSYEGGGIVVLLKLVYKDE